MSEKFDDKSATLRDLIATQLTDIISNGVSVVDGEGKVVKVPASAQYFAVARALVKDFPPSTLPPNVTPVGVLGEHLSSLPFAGNKEATH